MSPRFGSVRSLGSLIHRLSWGRFALLLAMAIFASATLAQYALADSSIPLTCPWPAGQTWMAGGSAGGNFYNEGGHTGSEQYAVDFNRVGADDFGQAVYPAAAGVVYSTAWDSYGGGWVVKINHANGLMSTYAHLKQAASVSVGQNVSTSTIIGYCGNSGSASTGSHLHFSLRQWSGSTLIAVVPQPMEGKSLYDGIQLTAGPKTASEGSFVQVSGSATIYRIAGGAPLAVSNWNAVGGAKPYTVISQAQFNALPAVPRDGTVVNARTSTGAEYGAFVFAGGAPIYISSWTVYGGQPAGLIGIDAWAIQHLNHMRAVPAGGTFVKASTSATIYRIAGGAPLPVSNWAAVGGSQPYVKLDPWALQNLTSPMAHMNAVPADGTFVNARTSTGAEYGAFIFAGGAPLYISSWSVYGGVPAGLVGIDAWAIQHLSHMRAVPASGTFIAAGNPVYRIAGGAPVWVSAWSVFGGVKPVVKVDPWVISNITNPAAHLNKAPADGTVVEGLPSHTYWLFGSGYRRPAAASAAAVQEDDLGLAAFPVDSTRPTTTLTGLPATWSRSPVTLTLKAVDNSGGSGMTNGFAKTEHKLDVGAWTAGTSLTVAAPADHSKDGRHTVSYRSTDAAGNTEATKSATVRIDTLGPRTYASATTRSTTRYHAVSLPYKITDARSAKATSIRIVVKNSLGKVVKTFSPTTRATSTWYSVSWTPSVRGTYHYSVYAKDLAGNAQVVRGSAKVVVR